MSPKKIPKFHVNNVFKNEIEYEKDKKKTSVGWLKFLFLWHGDGTVATGQDYKDYAKAVSVFRAVAKIRKDFNLHEWEDTQTLNKQIQVLNLFREAIVKEEDAE